MHELCSEPVRPELRVRTLRSYAGSFVVDLGQRNARFIKRPQTWGLHRRFPPLAAFAFLPEPGYDIAHTWDAIPLLTRRPYVLTFESYLPRFPDDEHYGRLDPTVRTAERWAREQLLDDRCVALLALSQFALRQFRHQNADWSHRETLERKIEVLYPAVHLHAHDPKPAPVGTLRLLLVGRNIMGKGGPSLLRAHRLLRAAGVPVETTIVSSLDWEPDDYIGPSSKAYVDAQLALLRQDGVVLHRGLPNDRVLELMESAHFFVFPTFHDTFGFATIEALACATPVIATATCAQPEIVRHGESGFLLPFENDPDVGKWPWIYRRSDPDHLDAYDTTVEHVSRSLAATLSSYWEDRSEYERLSAGALERAATVFGRERARLRLEALYERCRTRLPRTVARVPRTTRWSGPRRSK
jgi:glycosyltransferase involved in cell wall biosynthesis